jgi:hypothetical protein
MHAYNSVIVLAAWKAGIPVNKVKTLFTRSIYEAAGYLDIWSDERERLLDNFKRYGLDLTSSFLQWGRYNPFMYSVDHPSIACVYDIAKTFMVAHGVPVYESHIKPADNLLNGPIFPVYPPIAEACGVKGSYLFKPQGEYRYFHLEEFIERSYASYEGRDPASICVNGTSATFFSRVAQILR